LKNSFRKYIIRFWILVLGLLLAPILIFWLASVGALGEMPDISELQNPKFNLASEIYSEDGEIIGKYYTENRVNIKYQEISPNVVNALIATEDARFYDHAGIDFRRAFTAALFLGSRGGASTITQQLAKMQFHGERGNIVERLIQKIKEWVIAFQLESNYTKEEILTMYLNRFDWINNAVGLKSAAKIYFSTTPDSLKIEEAAVLVGMAKNPSLYNPKRKNNAENALNRRNVVLYQMTQFNSPFTNEPFLTTEQFDSLKQLPLELKFQRDDHNSGLATYFREYLRPELLKWCRDNKKPDGSPYNLYRDGLKIYTTINSKMQQYAEEAVNEHMPKLQADFFKEWKGRKNAPFYNMNQKEINDLMETSIKRSERYRVLKEAGKSWNQIKENFETPVPMSLFSWEGEIDTVMTPKDSILWAKFFLRTGFMAMEPQTGQIRAWVGGINYKHFKYDQVKQGRRQTGSTFKPFVYALAMQEGWSPCYEVANTPVSFDLPEGGVWTPQNSNHQYGGVVTLKEGLAESMNTVTAYLMKQFGPQAVVAMARKLGVTSPLDPVPALCLGVADLSVYEVVGANSTFANKGVWIEPNYLTRIEDKNGNVLAEFIPKRNEAMSEEAAYLTLNLMEGVVQYGTGVRLRYKYGINTPIAGKTGTTQNNSDGWFVGLTPELVAGAWVGAEDRGVHFRSTALGQGANTGLPIWALFFKRVYADPDLKISRGAFEKPSVPISVETDCKKYKQENKTNDINQFDPFK